MSTPLRPMTSRKCGPLKGEAHVPGDKSISHRSMILGALSVGETRVTGLLEGEDVLDTAKAMQAFGATIERLDDGEWIVQGVGVGGFAEPDQVIDCGNAGTGVRLIMGGYGDNADQRDIHGRCEFAIPSDGADNGPAGVVWCRELWP